MSPEQRQITAFFGGASQAVTPPIKPVGAKLAANGTRTPAVQSQAQQPIDLEPAELEAAVQSQPAPEGRAALEATE